MIPISAAYHAARKLPGAKPRLALVITTAHGQVLFSDQAPDDAMLGTARRPTAGGGWYAGGGATGALESLDGGDLVKSFGELTETITSGNLLEGFTIGDPPSLTLVLSNKSGRISDIEAVSGLVAAGVDAYIGYAGLERADYIRRFSGKLESFDMDGETCTIEGTSDGPDLDEVLELAKAGLYANPKNEDDILPIPWGDMTTGGESGVWGMPCIDIDNYVYCLAGCPVLTAAQGNDVAIYNKDGEALGEGYTFNPAHNFEAQGQVATITFAGASGTDISFSEADNSVNSSTTTFGDWANWTIEVVNDSGTNKGQFKILTATANKLILDDEGRTVSDEAAGNSVSILADQARGEPLSARAKGRADAGALLENPVLIAKDYLLNIAGLADGDLDLASFNRAAAYCASKNYRAAGVLDSEMEPRQFLTDLLSCFLASARANQDGLVGAAIDAGPDLVSLDQVAGVIPAHLAEGAKYGSRRENLCTRVKAEYAYSWSAGENQASDDGESTADTLAEARFGKHLREHSWPWIRSATVAGNIQEALVEAFARPTREIVVDLDSMALAPLMPGDLALFSSDALRDEDRQPLRNQVVRVLEMSANLDERRISLGLMDTGRYLRTAIYAGGGWYAGGGAGGTRRDRREYV